MNTDEENAAVNRLFELQNQKEALDKLVAEAKDEVLGLLQPEPKKGTQTKTFETGWKLKIATTERYTLEKGDEKDYAPVRAALDELEEHVADNLVTWKPTLSATAYRLLSPEDKKVIDKVLTTDLSAPSVKFEPPKEK